MTPKSRVMALVLAGAVCASAVSGAEPSNSGSTYRLTYASKYSFQGIDRSASRPVLQPEVGMDMGELSVTAWGNYDQTQGVMNELDTRLWHPLDVGGWSGAWGYEYLRYFHDDARRPSQEVFTELSYKRAFTPSVRMHWDIDEGHGRYWTFGLARAIAKGGATTTLAGRLHLQEHYYGMTGIPSAESAVALSRAGMEVSLTRHWTWENGDFRGEARPLRDWVFALTLGAHPESGRR